MFIIDIIHFFFGINPLSPFLIFYFKTIITIFMILKFSDMCQLLANHAAILELTLFQVNFHSFFMLGLLNSVLNNILTVNGTFFRHFGKCQRIYLTMIIYILPTCLCVYINWLEHKNIYNPSSTPHSLLIIFS